MAVVVDSAIESTHQMPICRLTKYVHSRTRPPSNGPRGTLCCSTVDGYKCLVPCPDRNRSSPLSERGSVWVSCPLSFSSYLQ